MKIAVVTPVYPPYKGGMGAVASRYVADLKECGFAVSVFTPRYRREQQRNPEAVYLRPILALGNAAVLPQLLWRLTGFDLVHLHYTFYGAEVFVWLWSLITRKPYILTYHMQPQTNDWRNLLFRWHRYLLEPLILRGAQTVLVSSSEYAQSHGLRHRQLISLPFGVDDKRFTPGRDHELRERYHIPCLATVFIFVGKLDNAHSFKGLDILLQAAAKLDRRHAWRILIVGDGDRRAEYVSQAERLGIKDQVIFVGEVSETELPRYYRAADIHILPSTSQSEAFGLVTLEAASSGLPSIVSDLPGVRSLVWPHESGSVVAVANPEALTQAMLGYLDQPEKATLQGTVARQRVEKMYAHSVLAQRLGEVYNQLDVV